LDENSFGITNFLEKMIEDGVELEDLWITLFRFQYVDAEFGGPPGIRQLRPMVDYFWRVRPKIRHRKGLTGPDPFRRLTLEFRDDEEPFTLFSAGVGHLEEREAPRMVGDEVVGVAW
jgi:hypothetical protein